MILVLVALNISETGLKLTIEVFMLFLGIFYAQVTLFFVVITVTIMI